VIAICSDFEGVLGPEIWEEVSRATGITELMRTTKDEPNFQKLMDWRIGIDNDISLKDLQDVVSTLQPLEGAAEFIETLKKDRQVIIVTDCPWELVEPLIKKLGNPTAFANRFVVGDDGFIEEFHFRVADQKAASVRGLHEAGFRVIAMGDSYNDLSMLTTAEKGILFCSTEQIMTDYPHFKHLTTYKELLEEINQTA